MDLVHLWLTFQGALAFQLELASEACMFFVITRMQQQQQAAGCMQGVWLRDYEPVNQRKDDQTAGKDTLGEIKPSNAYKRRVAGTNWQ